VCVDGRNTVADEVLGSAPQVRDFLMDGFDALPADTQFTDRLSWLLPPGMVIMRMRKIAGCSGNLPT
jgi:hypothetical protein